MFYFLCISPWMSSLLGTKNHETCLMTYPVGIQKCSITRNWKTCYFRAQVFKTNTIYECKFNSDIDHALKGCSSVSESGFLRKWVRCDVERVSQTQLKKSHFYSCENFALWWIIRASESRQFLHLRRDNMLTKVCVFHFYLFSITC